MASQKITDLTTLSAIDPLADWIPVVDVSDTTMAATGTTKKILFDKVSHAITDNFVVCFSDETTALSAGTDKVKFRMPYAFTLTEVRCSLSTAQGAGNIFTVDINASGVSIFGTRLTVDNNEKTSVTAATPCTLVTTALTDDQEISIDIDQIGDGTAKGGKITFIGHRA